MINIVTDSSTLYSIEDAKKIGLYTVPLHITIEDKSYRDLEDIRSEELLEKIAQNKIPRTSQPSLGEKIELYNTLSLHAEVIDITMASGLSGTYNTALIAKEHCIRSEKIHVIDSMTLCGPHKAIVDRALEMAKKNATVQEILEMVEKARKTDLSYLLPLDYDFLVRGGRIRGVAAKIGGLLKIIPVLKKGENGEGLEKFSLNRTLKKAIQSVVTDLKENKVDNLYQFYISHANNMDLAEKFKNKIQEEFAAANIQIFSLSPSFITQGGPGCVAVQAIKMK